MTAPHPTDEDLSDLVEGVLPADNEAEVTAHVRSCAACGATVADLSRVQDLLRDLGSDDVEHGVPSAVGARLDAALAAERAGVSRETPAHLPTSSPPSRPRVDRPSGRPHDRPGAGATGPSSRRARHRAGLLTISGVLAAVALGGFGLSQLDIGSESSAGGDAAQSTKRQDGGGGNAVDREVRDLIGQERQASPGLKDAPEGRTPFSSSPGQPVPTCIREGIPRSETPLAASPAFSFEGERTFLVVLPHPGDTSVVDAYVLDRACVTDEAAGPAPVLLQRVVPRD